MTTHIYLPPVSEIAAIFEEECTVLGATSVDRVQDETRLFARAVCGPAELICAGDEVRGGVALRVNGPDVFFHPYSLRQVCVNGAIMPIVHGTSRIERIETEEVVGAVAFTGGFANDIRQAIRSCAATSRLSEAVNEMRSMAEMEASVVISMLMQLMHARGLPHDVVTMVLERYSSTHDTSAFGLVNAVTSIARDSQDPGRRWDLESIGGKLISSVGALVDAPPRSSEVLVGA